MRTNAVFVVVLSAALAACCAAPRERTEQVHVAAPVVNLPTDAVARVYPTQGNNAEGVVRFTAIPGGIRVVADLDGLGPNRLHAFHIHEFGDDTAADGTAAGGHYNPAGHPHGAPDPSMHHAGDLGNVHADGHGHAHHEMDVMGLTIAGPENAVIGRSVILHAGEDDFTTQPTGNAGARIGCGVIGVAKPPAPDAAK